MKITQSEVLEFLKQIGVDAEIVDEGSEYDQDTLLSAVDNNRKAILQPLIEEEAMQRFEQNEAKRRGRAGGELRTELVRKTGISRKVLDEIEKDSEAIDKAFEHYMGTVNSEKQEVKSKIDEILANHQKEIETLKNDYEEKVQSANQKYIDRDIKEFIAGQLKDAPIVKGADRNLLADDFKNHLQNKYHLSYDEAKKAAELFVKDNPNMPAMNASKNARISILDEAKEFFTPRGQWETDMSKRNPVDEMKDRGRDLQPQPNQPNLTNSHTDKKTAFMEQMKNSLQSAGQV